MWHRAAHAILVGSLLVLPHAAGESQEIVVGKGQYSGSALASSGDWLVVGPANGVDLYKRRAGSWEPAQHLDDPSHGDSISFGLSLDIDREWLAVGDYMQDVEGMQMAGAVYLFRRDGGDHWVRTQALLAPTVQSMEFFGRAITLRDGFLFVRNDPIFSSAFSLVRVYTLVGSQWLLFQQIRVHQAAFAKHTTVAFDAPWLLVGEQYYSPVPNASPLSSLGRARFFELSSTGFRLRQALHGSFQSFFGASVALDGDTALIGAPGLRNDAPGHNRVHVMRLDASKTWTLEQFLVPDVVGADAEGDQFGFHLDLRQDKAIIGAPFFDGDDVNVGGAVYLFQRFGRRWNLVEHLRPDDQEAGDGFGFTVHHSDDSALVSSPFHSHAGKYGSVYSFDD